jgi:hypothetical protein
MLDWKISVSTILAVLLSVLLANVLTRRREDDKLYREEAIKFKETFVAYLKALENPEANPALLVTQNYPEQDELARKLVLKLPKRKKALFLEQWKSYSKLHDEKKSLGFAAVIATEVDDLSKANLQNPEGIKYIYEQTEMRRKEIIKIVNDILRIL